MRRRTIAANFASLFNMVVDDSRANDVITTNISDSCIKCTGLRTPSIYFQEGVIFDFSKYPQFLGVHGAYLGSPTAVAVTSPIL